MTARDALGSPGLVQSAADTRHGIGGLLALQGPGPLDVRTGVMAGAGTVVVGNADTAPMSVSVNATHLVASKAAADGPRLGSNDGVVKVPVGAAPGSGTRIDLVWWRQQDSTALVSPDGTNGAEFGAVTTAAPGAAAPYASVPSGAVVVAEVAIPAGATATNGAGVVITNVARQTVARGAPIPVRTQAERDGLTGYDGLQVFRLDLGCYETFWSGSWRREQIRRTVTSGVIFGSVPPAGAPRLRQEITGTGTTSAGGGIAVTFPEAFTTGITSAHPENLAGGTLGLWLAIDWSATSLTGMTIRAYTGASPGAAVVPSATVPYNLTVEGV